MTAQTQHTEDEERFDRISVGLDIIIAERDHLRKINADLLEALKYFARKCMKKPPSEAGDSIAMDNWKACEAARSAIAAAKGE